MNTLLYTFAGHLIIDIVKVRFSIKSIFTSFFNRWSLLSLALTGLSLVIYAWKPSILPFSFITFTLSALWSLCFWNFAGDIVQLLSRIPSLVIRALMALFLPIIFIVGIKVYLEFKVFLDDNLIVFVMDDPEYLVNLLHVFFSNIWIVLSYLLLSILTFWYFSHSAVYKQKGYVRIIILLLLVAIGQNQFGKYGDTKFATIDTTYLFTSKKYLREKDQRGKRKYLKPSESRIEPAHGTSSQYNIVIILQESMSAEPLSLYGYNNPYTPFMQSWYENEKSQFVVFTDAMSISGCTNVSVPSLFTGVGPEEPYDKLMQMPFMWDYAKANGYSTAIISSQRFTWDNFRYFVKNKNLDILYTHEDSDLKTINDLGVDDIAMTLRAKQQIESLPKNKPIFFIYNTNALHKPFQDASSLLTIPVEIKDRYGKALYIIDKSVENIYKAFQARGELDKTIFVFTADHGEYAIKRESRLGSFLKEALQIPVYIRLPKSWIDQNPLQYKALIANADKRVTNLDLMPTLVDFLGAQQSNLQTYERYSGTSLFDSISNSRTIIALSTNEVRIWSNEGLGIYQDSFSYIIDNLHHSQLYNLNQDPNQYHNIINDFPQPYFDDFHTLIRNNQELSRIYTNYAK
ncbi:MAG: sulfatase-like hydrolase/transferase [Bacteroidia bacterium]|nr:sulfatase-like hydrolase/transferase [Bacteroidia bacterium]MCO5253953.1 sulfatase-like hydrolase/transferase [Bacteroidota bacterium]